MFRQLTSISIILLILCFSVSAADIPAHTKEFYVNDFADILSSETENMIVSSGKQMFEKDGSQIVVTTIKSLEGSDIESYSLEMAREYGIGSEKEDNGLLILLALEDREVRIEVGTGLEGIFNDAKVGRFLDDYAIPYFSEDNFDYGINNLYRAILTELGLENVEKPEEQSDSGGEIAFFVVLTIIIIMIVIYMINGGNVSGTTGGGSFRGYGGGGFSSGSGSSRGGGFYGGGGGFSGGGSSRKF